MPLFVLDPGVRAAGFDVPNRRAFLADCLADLDAGLRDRGGRLVLRSGDVVEETCAVAAECGARQVHVAGGVSGYAQRREERLRRGAGGGRPAAVGPRRRGHRAAAGRGDTRRARDHFAVFTPYLRRWAAEKACARCWARPARCASRKGSARPRCRRVRRWRASRRGWPRAARREGRARFESWRGSADEGVRGAARRSGRGRHLPALAASALRHALARRTRPPGRQTEGEGPDAFVRQLAWRDFHHQVLAARPRRVLGGLPRPRGDRWRSDEEEIAAWQEGRTGYPIVDAAMRQLLHEGWMHNRARLLAASFLTKTLYVDWRVGARHFLDLLVDGDVANNQLNWQWVAGTGNDTRPNRVLNPLTQAKRFDPDGEYVRRWVPELAGIAGRGCTRPWKLPDGLAGRAGLPGAAGRPRRGARPLSAGARAGRVLTDLPAPRRPPRLRAGEGGGRTRLRDM